MDGWSEVRHLFSPGKHSMREISATLPYGGRVRWMCDHGSVRSAPQGHSAVAQALHGHCPQESILYSLASPCESSKVATPSVTRSSKPR
jgi:hypothetical protein